MQSVQVCDKLAKFYIEWAWELEQVNNFKKAEQIFGAASDKITDAEEKEVLASKHKQFQARVMKKMLEKSDSEEPLEEQRTALSSLKGFGKKSQVGRPFCFQKWFKIKIILEKKMSSDFYRSEMIW